MCRRLIFIVHSLGGLVLKEALRISYASPDEHLQQTSQHTHGIAFMGTPHRGADIAPIVDATTKILRLFQQRVNSNLAPYLERGSPLLTGIEESFAVWLENKRGSTTRRPNITCFYEELELPTVGKVNCDLLSKTFTPSRPHTTRSSKPSTQR